MDTSKRSVDRAGDILRQTANSDEALDVLARWRNRHVYVINLAFILLKRYTDSKDVGNNAIYGQRLKRVESIVHKLKRLPQAKLSRLQDIGGCRVILSNYEKLRVLYNKLKKSRSILSNEKDYITYPKGDGYRGIHLIYQCHSNNPKYAGLKIELQLRTKLQHAWATTVEIIDSFEGEKLKLGLGSSEWSRFFYLVADEFAVCEQLPIHNNDIIEKNRLIEIKQLSDQLNIREKLMSYMLAMQFVNPKNPKNVKFFILKLMTKEKTINIMPFNNDIEAQNQYMSLEKEFISDASVNVLMVKTDSIKKVKKSYPNYFADSELFIQTLGKILNKFSSLNSSTIK